MSLYGICDTALIILRLGMYKVYNTVLLRLCGVGVGPAVMFEGVVEVHGGARIRIGKGVRLGAGVIIDAGAEGRVTIGDRSYVGRLSTILAQGEVRIGADCLIAPFCYIIDSDHGFHPHSLIRAQEYETSPISIGDDVWVGTRTVILRGASVGTGSVIGAGSVVTRSIPGYMVAAGVPARIMRRRGD